MLPPGDIGESHLKTVFDTHIELIKASQDGLDLPEETYFPDIQPDPLADGRLVSTRIIRRRRKRHRSTAAAAELYQPSSYVNSTTHYSPYKKRGSI